MAMAADDVQVLIDEALSRHAGLLLRSVEMAYGRDQHFDLVRRTVLATFGQQGLKSELRRILEASARSTTNRQSLITEA